jgi:predicted HTH transcriptional regulator
MAKEFKGVWIPKAIYQDKALNPTDKLIMSDIFTLGEYYKSNETIALEVGVSRATASRAITNLIDKGYITKYFDGRNRRLKLTHQPNQIDSPGGSNSVSRKLKLTQQEAQIDSAAGSNCVTSIQDSIQPSIHLSKHVSKGVIYPFQEKEFKDTWKIWIEERRENSYKKYSLRAEQAALHNLQKISNNEYRTAIKIINQSISHGWRGLFALKSSKQTKPEFDSKKILEWAYGKS